MHESAAVETAALLYAPHCANLFAIVFQTQNHFAQLVYGLSQLRRDRFQLAVPLLRQCFGVFLLPTRYELRAIQVQNGDMKHSSRTQARQHSVHIFSNMQGDAVQQRMQQTVSPRLLQRIRKEWPLVQITAHTGIY